MRHAERVGRRAARGTALAAGVAVSVLVAGAAHAQLSPKKGPIDITGDSMDVQDQQHVIVWKGNVEALQDGDRLRTDLLNIYYKAAPKTGGAPQPAPAAAVAPGANSIDRMEAIGNVYLVRPNEIVKGDKAVYTADNQTIVVSGDVVLTQGQDVGRGTRLVINVQTGNATLEGGPSARPRVVFYPKQSPQGPHR